MSENKKPIYICDGRKWCGSTEDCYLHGGLCSHTKELSHAKNFLEWNNTYVESATKSKHAAPSVIIIVVLMLLNLIQFLQYHLLRK